MAAAFLAAALDAQHQDFRFWREARPLVFGFPPTGLVYHAAYTVATSALMFVHLRSYWPGRIFVVAVTVVACLIALVVPQSMFDIATQYAFAG